ncbi:MAG TPA: transcription-repair coupling factor [Bacillota bacterium]|nr:transcription-repair coupling factor [Bacillota bacterium]
MQGIKSYLNLDKDFISIIDGITNNLDEQLVTGLTGISRSMLIAMIHQATHRPILLVTHQYMQAQQLYDDLYELIGKNVHIYPINEHIASEMAVASPELRSERIEALTNWTNNKSGILIAPISALKRMLPPIHYWEQYQLPFAVGETVDLPDYTQRLVNMGYERVSMVTTPGEFSIRGGIVDIYPVTKEHPIRIEFFDVEVDSIRSFDAETQLSITKHEQVNIEPAIELLLTDEDFTRGAEQLQKALSKALKQKKQASEKELLAENMTTDIEHLTEREHFQGIYKYIGLLYDTPMSLVDYLPNDGLIIFDEMIRIQETANHLDVEEAEWYSGLLENGEMVPDFPFSFDWQTIWARMDRQRLYLSVFLRHIRNTQPKNIVNISSRAMQDFHGQMDVLKTEIERWHHAEHSVVIVAPNEKRAQRIHSILADYKISATMVESVKLPTNELMITTGNISAGIELPMQKLAIITENELFKHRTQRKRRKQKISNAERIKSYQELNVGDYVVHESHGIGKYIGIETVEVSGLHKDYLVIIYSGDDRLLVPVDQIDLVQKYVGSEGKKPRLYKLGGSEWTKVKQRVQSSVEDIADELIKLYAEREAQKGYAFSPDTSMQREFEESFPYQETDDQLRCITEIKADMEKERPMDRLLCGDVGYGKTEVAIRAAFKAIADGKQVAILVPTTILAQQHFQTITERFQDYPINIGLLSRFRTSAQIKETLKDLKNGMIDLVIGTHRLLSKDIHFRDLGLLVVDEEQRFGVKHKERIKQLKTNVDVLTLTATPIPRTLHMSMLGVRDLSIIETPPENRFPVQTYVVEYHPMFIQETIEREISRGGQVFFLYNRVANIERMARNLNTLVPDARVGIAHGQMNESELENVMLSFLAGEFDVLVSTTIIETGVDIPNVNTLIVYNADHMGLSQLYQLRGRVGRSNRIAYAYFTYQKDKILTEVAEKRLQAIKEFTELGSGFKLAMRDLSIRGAGNLLGSQQHGFIDSVGFDMYTQMLQDAINERKEARDTEKEEATPIVPELSLSIDAYIPSSYIQDERQKIDMYKRFQLIRTKEEVDALKEEIVDRFGHYPEQVKHLFTVSLLKSYAVQERIESITETAQKIEIFLDEERSQKIDGAKLFDIAHSFGRNIQLGSAQNKIKIVFRWSKDTFDKRYDVVIEFLQHLAHVNRD